MQPEKLLLIKDIKLSLLYLRDLSVWLFSKCDNILKITI